MLRLLAKHAQQQEQQEQQAQTEMDEDEQQQQQQSHATHTQYEHRRRNANDHEHEIVSDASDGSSEMRRRRASASMQRRNLHGGHLSNESESHAATPTASKSSPSTSPSSSPLHTSLSHLSSSSASAPTSALGLVSRLSSSLLHTGISLTSAGGSAGSEAASRAQQKAHALLNAIRQGVAQAQGKTDEEDDDDEFNQQWEEKEDGADDATGLSRGAHRRSMIDVSAHASQQFPSTLDPAASFEAALMHGSIHAHGEEADEEDEEADPYAAIPVHVLRMNLLRLLIRCERSAHALMHPNPNTQAHSGKSTPVHGQSSTRGLPTGDILMNPRELIMSVTALQAMVASLTLRHSPLHPHAVPSQTSGSGPNSSQSSSRRTKQLSDEEVIRRVAFLATVVEKDYSSVLQSNEYEPRIILQPFCTASPNWDRAHVGRKRVRTTQKSAVFGRTQTRARTRRRTTENRRKDESVSVKSPMLEKTSEEEDEEEIEADQRDLSRVATTEGEEEEDEGDESGDDESFPAPMQFSPPPTTTSSDPILRHRRGQAAVPDSKSIRQLLFAKTNGSSPSPSPSSASASPPSDDDLATRASAQEFRSELAQRALLAELQDMTSDLKSNAMRMRTALAQDAKVLDQADSMLDTNLSAVRVQNSRLKQWASHGCSDLCWNILIIVIVWVVFIGMFLFMKLFKKSTT